MKARSGKLRFAGTVLACLVAASSLGFGYGGVPKVDTIADTSRIRDTEMNGLFDVQLYNYGTRTQMRAGRENGVGERTFRALLRFDSQGWPDSARIDSVLIELTAGSGSGDDTVWVKLQEVLVSWGEGRCAGCIPDSCDSAATWIYRHYDSSTMFCPSDTVRWSVAGCGANGADRAAQAADSVRVGSVALSKYRFHVTALGKKWAANSSANRGVLITGPETQGQAGYSYRNFYTKELTTAAYRPRCLIFYREVRGRIAYLVADTLALGTDTLFVRRLQNKLGYDVRIMDDERVPTYSSWSADFDGIVISDLASATNVPALRDTAVGILTLDRYTETEFGFGLTNYRPSGHGRKLVNRQNAPFICGTFLDTLFMYQYDNQYFYYYGDLAAGAVVPFSTPDLVGHDSACVILLDSGAVLAGGGYARERRAFSGVFRTPASMDRCLSWELFDRLVAWMAWDTLNLWLNSQRCWAGYREIDACWCEMTSGQNDSATYNSEFRFGYDGDDILGLWRLTDPGRKKPSGRQCDSLTLHFPVFALGFNGAPPDSVMDLRIDVYRIIKSTKWHGPPPNSGGDPYLLDSTWVTRWDVYTGANPIPWDTVDLRAGVDYDGTSLAYHHLIYPTDSIGDTLKFAIPGSVFDLWAADSAQNNGLLFKVTALYDQNSNIEYSTRPPYENAVAIPMMVTGWFSPPVQSGGARLRANLIGNGLAGERHRTVLNCGQVGR